MILLPINQTLEENPEFINHPDCQDSLVMSVNYYKAVGFDPPWIGYYAQKDNQLVGSAAFKGAPKNGKVEIAYGTFPKFQHQGIGTEMCHQLVQLAIQTDLSVTITARTLPEKNYSTRILEKNGFMLHGTVIDPDDGEIWEWEFQAQKHL